jgi:hypothetical protein
MQGQPVIPISAWIRVPSGPAYATVRAVLEAVNAVHGDGEMRPLPVVRTRSRTDAGEYLWRQEDGEPLALRFSIHSDHPHLTIAHEIGHFVDQHAFGLAGRFASASGRVPAIMRAIDHSQAAVALRALVGRASIVVEIRPGRRERQRVVPTLAEYFLRPEELFARAYAQYIAVQSGHSELVAELLRRRSALLSGRVYHTQWEDWDFVDIQDAFTRALMARAWTI